MKGVLTEPERILLVDVIEDALSHKHESPSRLFGSCYDWHSACHAYWALTELSPTHAVLDAITTVDLEFEASLLRKSEEFENPYGRSWFCLLLRRLEERPRLTECCVRLRSEMSLSVQSHFDRAKVVTEGAHGSLLFALMLLKLSDCSAGCERMMKRASDGAPYRSNVDDSDFCFLPSLAGTVKMALLLFDAHDLGGRSCWRATL